MDFGFSVVASDAYKEKIVNEIMNITSENGENQLSITRKEALKLIEYKESSLNTAGRIEFGQSSLNLIIEAFSDSPFINRADFVDTIGELTELFYYYKNETIESFTDAELIEFMKFYFNGECNGSIELLNSNMLDELARQVRSGEFWEPNEETENEDDNDEM